MTLAIHNNEVVGLLRMSSEEVDGFASANDYAVARINQELPNRSSIGALVVDRQGDGSLLGNGPDDENQTYALDGRWGIGNNALIQAWTHAKGTLARMFQTPRSAH